MKLLPVRRNTFHRFLSKLFIQPMKVFRFVKDNIQCPPVHDFTKRMLKKCNVQGDHTRGIQMAYAIGVARVQIWLFYAFCTCPTSTGHHDMQIEIFHLIWGKNVEMRMRKPVCVDSCDAPRDTDSRQFGERVFGWWLTVNLFGLWPYVK